jgi:hypothetical protein
MAENVVAIDVFAMGSMFNVNQAAFIIQESNQTLVMMLMAGK